MIQLQPNSLSALARWFPARTAGPATLVEHVLGTGTGRWWADSALQPQVVAVTCANHVLLRGDPHALALGSLAPFADSYVEAPPRFLPVLGASFDRIVPGERMVYVRRAPASPPARRPLHGVTVRPLVPEDARALAALGSETAWIHASWEGPAGLGERLSNVGEVGARSRRPYWSPGPGGVRGTAAKPLASANRSRAPRHAGAAGRQRSAARIRQGAVMVSGTSVRETPTAAE
ncbi:hypothetical protein ACFVYE_15920 [Streptomyces sp. NPDC058239]|uniref:hypothetical protein n=1 Tax=Streptomyces sp. NPDC058239 TaxID=3346395 RepID=UPI0036ED1B9A